MNGQIRSLAAVGNGFEDGSRAPPSSTRRRSPLEDASLWSRFWFGWSRPLLDLGRRRPLEAADVPAVRSTDQSRHNERYINRLWEEEKRRCSEGGGRPSLARAMARDYVRTMRRCRWTLVVNCSAKIAQALALGFLLESFKEDAATASGTAGTGAYFWACVIVGCGLVAFPTKQHSFFWMYEKGNRYRTGLISAIYAKSLRLPSIGNSSVAGGQVTNLASNDVERFSLTCIHANLMLVSPFEILAILSVGLYTMGAVFLFGYLLLIVVMVPLQYFLGSRFRRLRSKIAALTDARVSLVEQAIVGIRTLRLQGWEVQLEEKIAVLRSKEVQQLRATGRLKALNDAIYFVSSLVTGVSVCGIYVGIFGEQLTPRIVFTTFTLWNMLQASVTKHIPHAIMNISECYVSCQRIQTLLELPEHEVDGQQKQNEHANEHLWEERSGSQILEQQQSPVIKLVNATCYWDNQTRSEQQQPRFVALDRISLTFQPGKLYCVIGKVGSGKSALLQALMGELPLRHGQRQLGEMGSTASFFSYTAQDPWVMDGSARENILMGLPYNAQRYQEIVEACCLVSDFASFGLGDRTIVGDRGIQCSGGQRARLALARALYDEKTQMILLDDPLSAVDAHVANAIYQNAIQKLAVKRGKCVVLATHQLQFAGSDDSTCILLDRGKLVCCGPYTTCASQFESGRFPTQSMRLRQDKEEEENTPEEGNSRTNAGDIEEKIDTSFIEKRNTGVIQGRTWISYGRALGGLIICALFSLIFSLTQAVFLVTMTFVGLWAEATPVAQRETYWWGVVFGCMACTVLLAVVRAQMSFHLFLQASKRLHNQMLRSVIRAKIEFYDTNPLGRILNRFSADVGIMDEVLPLTIYEFGVGIIMFVASIFTAIAVLPLVLVVFPILLWAFLYFRKIFTATTRELKRLEGLGRSPIYACLSESLSGIGTIRANNKTIYFSNKFEALHNSLVETQFAFVAISRWFATKLDFLSFVFLFVATMSAVTILDQGWLGLDPAIVGLALSLLLQLAGSNFPMMVRQSAEVINQMVSVERILEFGHSIAQEAPLTTSLDRSTPNWPEETSIVVDNLHARYRDKCPLCLEGVSFSIQPGERVGVVGRTGAGKTSLLQALFRVLEAEKGSIRIGGLDIARLGLHKLRTNMAVITQAPVLFGGCTIRENLDPYPDESGEEADARLERALRSVHMWETVQSVPNGVDGMVGEGGSNFSAGQRQLLCLARSLLEDCRILVLDEATANVDQITDGLLQQTLRERFESATIIAIAHRLDTIIGYDKVLVLGDGRVLEFGPPAVLLQNKDGHFTSMVESTGTAMAELLRQKVKIP